MKMHIFLLFANSDYQHLHHHYQYYSKYKQNNITANETEYKAAPGEILAKDSILYSQQPESRQLRRQLWPIMEETMQKLATSVSTGAQLLKHIMQPSKAELMKYQNMQKARKIKNVYLSARKPFAVPLVATKNTHKRHTASKKQKKPVIPKPVIIDSGEMTTLSDDYKLTYGKTPSYVVKTAAKNLKPYSELGVTGYKHFEKTVLRELEEKEEKKVEATMATLNSGEEHRPNAEIDLIKGIPNGGWTPVVKLLTNPTTEKPHTVSKLHTNVNHFDATIRPIHEDAQESKRVEFESTVERPSTAASVLPSRHSKYASRIPKGFASTVVTTTTQKPVLASAITKDQPNYPDYFLRKNKHLMHDSKKQSTTKAVKENSAPSIYSQLMDMETSSSMNTPRIPRVSQRQKATTNTTITSTENTKTKSGRGSIRFGKDD